MAVAANRTRPSTAGAITRPIRRLAPEHAALIAVSVAYCLFVFWRVSHSMALTYDEVVYASQVSTDTPAVRFTAPRARGMPLLLAPVVTITEWVVALRVYLTLVSGLLMYLAFRPWLAIFRQVGDRYRFVPAIAAGFLATLWLTIVYGALGYPNLWLAFMLVAGVGYAVRAVREPVPARWPLAGVVASFAVASLLRPTDALAAAGPLLLVAVVRRSQPWLQAGLAVATGLAVGWAAWIGEAFARFGGPIERLRAGAEINGGGLVNSLPEHLHALDGPAVLCRQQHLCEGIDPLAAWWWFALPVLVAVGLAAARRTGWLAAGGFATAAAVALAVPYLFLIDYAAARFLLPAYALLALPAAGGAVWLSGLGRRAVRVGVTTTLVAALALHAAGQQAALGPVSDRLERVSAAFAKLGDYLRDEQGVQAPCLVWGEGAIQLSYLLKCRSVWEQGGGPPAEDDAAITAAMARGDDIVVRIRADAEPPALLAGWRRVALPGSGTYVAYLPR